MFLQYDKDKYLLPICTEVCSECFGAFAEPHIKIDGILNCSVTSGIKKRVLFFTLCIPSSLCLEFVVEHLIEQSCNSENFVHFDDVECIDLVYKGSGPLITKKDSEDLGWEGTKLAYDERENTNTEINIMSTPK